MKYIVTACIKTFLFTFIGIFFLIFSFLNIFYQFNLLSAQVLLFSSCTISITFSLICAIVSVVHMRSEKRTRLSQWINLNAAKFASSYLLLTAFFYSIRPDLCLATDDIKSLISLEWGILSISVTVFLIWNVVIMEYLEKRKPHEPKNALPTKVWIYLQEKENFYSDATQLLSNARLLFFNLIAVCIATYSIYISSETRTLISQSIAIFALYFSSNTILGLILDILRPFNERKKALLQDTKATAEDLKRQNKIAEETEKVLTTVETIEKLQDIDPSEKYKLKYELLKDYINTYGIKSLESTPDKGDDND